MLAACRRRGDRSGVEVRDNGPSRAESQELIFHEFVQLDTIRETQTDKGLGYWRSCAALAPCSRLLLECARPARDGFRGGVPPNQPEGASQARHAAQASRASRCSPDEDPTALRATADLAGWGCTVEDAADADGVRRPPHGTPDLAPVPAGSGRRPC